MKVTKFIYHDIFKREINIGDNILFRSRDFGIHGLSCSISLGIINELLQPVVLHQNIDYNTIDGSLELDCYKLSNINEDYFSQYIYYLNNNLSNSNYDIFNRNLCVGSLVLYFERWNCNYKPMYGLMFSNNSLFTLDCEIVNRQSVYLIDNPIKQEIEIYKSLVTSYNYLFLEGNCVIPNYI